MWREKMNEKRKKQLGRQRKGRKEIREREREREKNSYAVSRKILRTSETTQAPFYMTINRMR